jgi:hypothetical protein
MAQQTAVEWFYQRILAEDIKEVFEQAKAMEKQQITFAYNDGANAMVSNKYKGMKTYYNEMYQSSQDKADN